MWLIILKCCVSLTLLARGWLTWKWDSPIRGLFWREDWWGGLIDWKKFATESDSAITMGLETVGLIMMVSAVIPWLASFSWLKWTGWLLIPAAGILMVDSLARFADSGNELGMAIEHTLQWSSPLFLLAALYLDNSKRQRSWTLLIYVAIALTFIGHGFYAMGFHSVPLKFQTMTTTLLKLSESGALIFLSIAGYLDFLAAIGLFIPGRIRTASVIYTIAWGALTAFARVAVGPGLDPWLMETLVRSSHWMIPLVVLLLSSSKQSLEESSATS